MLELGKTILFVLDRVLELIEANFHVRIQKIELFNIVEDYVPVIPLNPIELVPITGMDSFLVDLLPPMVHAVRVPSS